jgi:hypothetical protein
MDVQYQKVRDDHFIARSQMEFVVGRELARLLEIEN